MSCATAFCGRRRTPWRTFTPDPAEISKAVEEQLDTMSAQLAQNNLTLDDYCKFSNSTLEQLREDARPGAEEAVRIKALVRRVAQAEELHAHERTSHRR